MHYSTELRPAFALFAILTARPLSRKSSWPPNLSDTVINLIVFRI
jgi:hypothetical protein